MSRPRNRRRNSRNEAAVRPAFSQKTASAISPALSRNGHHTADVLSSTWVINLTVAARTRSAQSSGRVRSSATAASPLLHQRHGPADRPRAGAAAADREVRIATEGHRVGNELQAGAVGGRAAGERRGGGREG